jgi:hypothetical protein
MTSDAEAVRRQIERDLHDGTQQRLVSVAMSLGLADAKLRSGCPYRQEVALPGFSVEAALGMLQPHHAATAGTCQPTVMIPIRK